MANSRTKDFREAIAKEFIASLQEETKEWHKTWRSGIYRPQNINGSNYKGINYLYLSILCAEKGWEDPRFATFNQIQKNGWHLQKGAKGNQVEYWFPYDKKQKKTISWEDYKNLSVQDRLNVQIIPKYYYVFNAKDIEGIPPLPEVEKNEISPDIIISKLSKNMDVEIYNDGGNKAYYSPLQDNIHLPDPGLFEDDYAYNSTALHELAHASGAQHRLGRDMSGGFGSSEYAYEELVAEISSSFMAQHLERCEFQMDNHKAYIQSWIQMIEEDKNVLIKAIKDAEKCANYLEYHAELITEKEYESLLQVPERIDEKGRRVPTEEERRNEIWKDIQKSGYKPTDKMVNHIRTIERVTGNERTLKELAQLHKNKPNCMKGTLAEEPFKELVQMCKQQELVQKRAVPITRA